MISKSMPYEGKEPYIFMSYSHKDAAKVFPLLDKMIGDGYRIWYDQGNHPGDDWAENIAQHLYKCQVCLLMLTRNSGTSSICRSELTYARANGKKIMAIKLEDFQMTPGMEMQLSTIHYLNGFEYSSDEKLLKVLYETEGMDECRDSEGQVDEHKPDKTRRSLSTHKKVGIGIFVAILVAVLCLYLSGVHIHNWNSATCDSPKTCSICGETKGDIPGHLWNEADCENPRTCSECGAIDGEALGHNWIEATFDAPKTCIQCGKTEGSPLTIREKNSEIMDHAILGAGRTHSVALSNGRVLTAGDNESGQIDLKAWNNLISIAGGDRHTVGLRVDGTVMAAGQATLGQCDVKGWTDVKAIAAGDYHTVAICENGALLATGWNTHGQCSVEELNYLAQGRGIIQVAAGYEHTVALFEDGTVAAIGCNDDGRCNVSAWTDIVAVWAGTYHTVGLKKDGTVVAVGKNNEGQCDVSAWENIVYLCAGDYHTVGVKADGTVVAVGRNAAGQCDLNSWSKIISVVAGRDHTIGVRSDGTVVAAGRGAEGQCKVNNWLIMEQNEKKSVSDVDNTSYATVGTIFASSEYDKDSVTHSTHNLVDGNVKTNWTEGVPGYGVGEYLEFTFTESCCLYEIYISAGNFNTESYFLANSRPASLRLTYEDGSSEVLELQNVMQEQILKPQHAVPSKTVRLTIESVYEGSKYQDTVISEIYFRISEPSAE